VILLKRLLLPLLLLLGVVISGPFERYTNHVMSAVFSPDGKHIIPGSGDRTIRDWDAEGDDLVYGPFEGHTGGVMSVALSQDGTRIISGSGDNTIRVLDGLDEKRRFETCGVNLYTVTICTRHGLATM